MKTSPNVIVLPSGKTLKLPEIPPHHHAGACECEPTLAYIRISDLAGREEVESPDIQMDSISYLSVRKNRRIVKVIYDIDETGQTFENRQVGEALKDIKVGLYRTVSLWSWSRWGRELEQCLYWLRLVKEAGGEVDSATEEFDQSTASGLLGRNMMLVLADWQGKVIGQNWRAVHGTRRKKGLPHTGRPRFGYLRLEEPLPLGEGKLREYVRGEHADELTSAYASYVAGQSLRSTTRDWNGRGIRTVNGKLWTPQAVGKMLDTGFAAGLIRERANPGAKPANQLLSYDVWRDGTQEQLISKEVWAAYRARRTQQAQLPPRARTAAHELSSLLYCGGCGRRMNTKYAGRNRTHNWVCSFRSSYHPDFDCSMVNKYALPAVRDWVLARASGQPDVEEEARRINAAREATDDVTRIEKEMELIERRQARLLDLWLDDGITRQAYDTKRAQEDEKAAVLRAGLADAQQRKVGSGANLDYAFAGLAKHWDEFEAADIREALVTVVAGAIVRPGRGQWRLSIFPKWESAAFDSEISALRKTAAA